MIRCLVSDLDGTLFYQHKENLFELSDRNHIFMQRLVNDPNIRFCVASGRNVYYGQHIMNKYDFKDQVISGYNGVTCLDKGQYAYKEIFDYDLLLEIHELAKDLKGIRDYQYLTIAGDRVFHDLNAISVPFYQKEIDIMKIGRIYDTTIDEYLKTDEAKTDVSKLCINFLDVDSALIALDIFKKELSSKCFVTKSSDKAVEISDLNRNKGSFIEYLMQTYGYQKDEIAVIGDALNDTDMFKHVTHSFAMAHANQDVKDLAKYVVEDVAECYEMILKMNNSKE